MSVRVAVEQLHVELGGHKILHDVSLAVEPGEFLTLLGPSGSGKTTTLNVLAGFIGATRGRVLFGDERVDAIPPHKRDIGIVFQSYGLFPHMTVGENVAFPLRIRDVERQERARRVGEALELVRLGGMGDRRVASLSGGQQQRVALARALVFRPKLLLLDEPLAALDKQLREHMQVELKSLQREVGVTTVAVTHDQVEALTMSDKVAVMCDGRVEQHATPRDLYRRPSSLFVAGFVGEANLLSLRPGGELPELGLRFAAPGGTAVVRPEDVTVTPAADGRAVVSEVAYQGTRLRLIVTCDGGGAQLVANFPPQLSDELIDVGTRVALECAAERVHLIAETSAAPTAAPLAA